MVHSSIINSSWQPLPTLAAVKLVPIITIFYGVRRIVTVHVSTQVGYYLQTPPPPPQPPPPRPTPTLSPSTHPIIVTIILHTCVKHYNNTHPSLMTRYVSQIRQSVGERKILSLRGADIVSHPTLNPDALRPFFTNTHFAILTYLISPSPGEGER